LIDLIYYWGYHLEYSNLCSEERIKARAEENNDENGDSKLRNQLS
jgi:hypothetical protein